MSATEESAGTVKQLALLMQARDARQWGAVTDGVVHPTWDEASLIGQEEYLRDAGFLVEAMQLLGWGDLGEKTGEAESLAEALGPVLDMAQTDAAAGPINRNHWLERLVKAVVRAGYLSPEAVAARVRDERADAALRTARPELFRAEQERGNR